MKKVVISLHSNDSLRFHAACPQQPSFAQHFSRFQVYSSEIRDYRTMEKKCANAGEFEMAKRYNRSIDRQASTRRRRRRRRRQSRSSGRPSLADGTRHDAASIQQIGRDETRQEAINHLIGQDTIGE